MFRFIFIILICFQAQDCIAQYNWKLEKDKNGIKVYLSDVKNSAYKAIKVECTLSGNYNKLISLLSNVPHFKDWIYNSKNSKVLSKSTPLDFIYYSETRLPTPFSNRDIVIHLQIVTDNLPHFLSISGKSKPGILPDVSGKVRVKHYNANWKVTMPTTNTIQINYIVEMEPGGSIPGWLVNMYSEKGPFETFSNLAKQLMK